MLCAIARSGDVAQLEALLDASALLDVVDQRGYSPLMCAVENATCPYACQLLLLHGANVNFAAVRAPVAPPSQCMPTSSPV